MDYAMDVQMMIITEDAEPVQMMCPALAMAYVPMQTWQCPPEDLSGAFCTGSLFPCLVKPFMGGGCCV